MDIDDAKLCAQWTLRVINVRQSHPGSPSPTSNKFCINTRIAHIRRIEEEGESVGMRLVQVYKWSSSSYLAGFYLTFVTEMLAVPCAVCRVMHVRIVLKDGNFMTSERTT